MIKNTLSGTTYGCLSIEYVGKKILDVDRQSFQFRESSYETAPAIEPNTKADQ